MRDELRVQAYLDERFASRPADLAEWIATLRQRAGIRQPPGATWPAL